MEIDAVSDDALPAERFSLYVFLSIRTAQLQHGLRHGDYERYRNYCTARVARIRKKLAITNRRSQRGGKPTAKPPELHTLSDPRSHFCTAPLIESGLSRALQIPLMLCERAWAYGMQKKGELAAMGHSLKRRGTMLRKFTQAAKASNSLVSLCERKCDQRSCLEATSYSEIIKGVACMESEKKWKEALLHFLKAKEILGGLAKISEVEVQSVFLQAIEELEPNIRFCRYELQKRNEEEEMPSLEEVKEQLEKMKVQTESSAETVSALSISWCQNQYPVKNEKLSEYLQTAQKHEKQLTATKQDHASRVATYEKVIAAYMEMENNIKKALAAGGGVSVFAGEDLEQLQMAVVGKLLRHSIEKTKLQVHRNQELFQETLVKGLSSKKQQGVKSRAEILVRLCDSMIGLILEQSELGMKLGGAHGEDLIEECTLQASYFQAFRCFYVAHVFRSTGSFPESYALFDRCIERTNTARKHLSDVMDEDDSTNTSMTAELTVLHNKALAFKCSAQAEMSAGSLIEIQETQKKLEVMEMDGGEESSKGKKTKKPPLPAQRYMADHLNQWEAFVGSEGRNIRLFKIPPPLSMIPVRPFILDSTPNHIQKPDLKSRLPPEEAQGVFSKIFGFSGWK